MTNVRGSRRPRRLLWIAAIAAFGVVAAGCIPEPPADAPITEVSISTSPGLFPAFSPDIYDYVVRCTGDPIRVVVNTPDSQPMIIDGREATTGHIEVDVAKSGSQGFEIIDTSLLRAYSVRCLPPDYPNFTVTRNGATQAEYYLTSPIGLGFPVQPQYVTIFDSQGVPLWWSKTKLPVLYADLLNNGNLGYVRFDNQPMEEHRLDGTLVRTIRRTGIPDDSYDTHDLLRLANGNYVFVYNREVPGQDLTSLFPNHADDTDCVEDFAGNPDGTDLADAGVLDHVLVEVTPDGTPVWEWSTFDHIDPTEMDPQWEEFVCTAPHDKGYDVFHWNSVEATADGSFLLSFRHLDAIYSIDRSGDPAGDNIEWKLGGSTIPESLTIVGDPVFDGGSHFGGQHDARMLPDGTVTLFDNGSDLGRAPRGVRYQIALNDPAGHTGGTATLVEQVSDPTDVPSSFCCGSARRLSGGNWVFGFGGTGVIAELTPSGAVLLRIVFDAPLIEYRTVPIPSGRLYAFQLRAAMNTQNP